MQGLPARTVSLTFASTSNSNSNSNSNPNSKSSPNSFSSTSSSSVSSLTPPSSMALPEQVPAHPARFPDGGVPGYDIYGFPYPRATQAGSCEKEYAQIRSQYQAILDRRGAKWDAYIKRKRPKSLPPDAVDFLPRASHTVKILIRGGIPPRLRRQVWLHYSGARKQIEQNRGVYHALFKRAELTGTNMTQRQIESLEVIDRDIPRTFPENPFFAKTSSKSKSSSTSHTTELNESTSMAPKMDIMLDCPSYLYPCGRDQVLTALRRVLVAFSQYNNEIGYCQSLNFIVGMLLVYLSEEEAFWMLVVLTEKVLPEGVYTSTLSGTIVEMKVFKDIVREKCGTLRRKIEKGDCGGLDIIVGPWFMTLFVNVLPPECVLRVWDCLFFEGSKILYRAALAVLKILEPQILRHADPVDAIIAIQKGPRTVLDPELLMRRAFKRFGAGGVGSLSRLQIDKYRRLHNETIKQQSAQNGSQTSADTTSTFSSCSFNDDFSSQSGRSSAPTTATSATASSAAAAAAAAAESTAAHNDDP